MSLSGAIQLSSLKGNVRPSTHSYEPTIDEDDDDLEEFSIDELDTLSSQKGEPGDFGDLDFGDEKFVEAPVATAGSFSSVLNILKNVINSGFLSLAFAIKQSSIIPGLLIMILTCAGNIFTFNLIAKCCKEEGVYSYRQLWSRAYGSRLAIITDLTIFIYAILGLGGYIILLGDFGKVMLEVCSEDSLCANRTVIQVFITVVVIFPLCLLRDIRSLWVSSLLGFAAIVYTGGFISFSGVSDLSEGEPVIMKLQFGIFEAMAIFNTAFMGHFNAPRYFEELKGHDVAQFKRISYMSYGFILAFYILAAVIPYVSFGEKTSGDILNNYPVEGNLPTSITRLALMFCVTFGFPISFNGLKYAAQRLVSPHRDMTFDNFVVLSSVLLVVCLIIGVIVPDISKVSAFRGATLGTLIVYVYPCLIYMQLGRAQGQPRSKRETVFCWFWIIFGSICGLLGVIILFSS